MGVRFSRRGEETAERGRRQGRRKLVVRSTDCGGVSAGRRRRSTSFSPPRGYHWRSSKGRGALSFSGTRPIYSSPFLGKVLIASTSPVVGSPAVGADHFVNCKRPNALPLLHRNLCTLYSVAQKRMSFIPACVSRGPPVFRPTLVPREVGPYGSALKARRASNTFACSRVG